MTLANERKFLFTEEYQTNKYAKSVRSMKVKGTVL